jgi:hypothetical protein
MNPLLALVRQFFNLVFSQSSVLDCLKRLRATKGSRNALKKVDYDNVQHLKVDYLPPVFNSDVVF